MQLGLACHVCGSLNALSAGACMRCGTVLAPAASQPVAAAVGAGHPGPVMAAPQIPGGYPPSGPTASAPPPSSTTIPRASANDPGDDLETAPQHRFDPKTGQPIAPAMMGAAPPAKTMFFGALQQQPVVPRLVVIKGEGGDGNTYHLQGVSTVIGRARGEVTFVEDPFLSPEHAKFTSQNGRLFVQDVGSTNGVFLRIKKPTPLHDADYLLVGEQLLRLRNRPFGDGSPNDEGTYYYGSPRPGGQFQVIQCLAGGGEGRITTAENGALSLGREGNTMNFPDDRFISGHHARLDASSDGDHVMLTDTGSRNGTFIRINTATELFHGDYLFVGQQLLRVEIA